MAVSLPITCSGQLVTADIRFFGVIYLYLNFVSEETERTCLSFAINRPHVECPTINDCNLFGLH